MLNLNLQQKLLSLIVIITSEDIGLANLFLPNFIKKYLEIYSKLSTQKKKNELML